MPRLYLIRHGRASGSWDAELDPELDALGRTQSRAIAEALAPRGPLDVIASPMVRTRETAVPLTRTWGVDARIDPRVGEIPSPESELEARGRWLQNIAYRTWSEMDERLQRWRREVLAALHEATVDTVVVTHFVAINVAVGSAVGDDRVMSFSPDYCSVTTLRSEPDGLKLIERGAERRTRVL